MCRFAAYLGPEIFISSLVTEPRHSIIHQSYHAKERIEPLNGDGFGIGWYAPPFCDAPAVFKDVAPAWSNQNLRNVARVTKSTCIFAHVRAATVGGQVSQSNCHPFSWKNYLFMHNGTVFGFDKIRRVLRQGLSDEVEEFIQGNTDTEHVFALFLDEIKDNSAPDLEQLSLALLMAISRLEQMKREAGVVKPSTLNLVLSDGKRMLATRYVSKGYASNSLYLLIGGQFHCREGLCSMDGGQEAVLIASEPLNRSKKWQKVENNHLVAVDYDRTTSIVPIETRLP
ncbi:MAG: glutamine amidotransferase [Desulforhopalus sp.]|jgi:glutamine amidotransferase